MPKPQPSKEQLDHAIQVAINNLRHGVPVRITAIQTGIHYQRLYRALRHNLDAYVARCEYLTTGHLARDPKADAFLKRRRLERLVTYRALHGLGPNPPQPRKNKRGNSVATPGIESSTQAIDCKDNPSGKGAELPPNMPPCDAA